MSCNCTGYKLNLQACESQKPTLFDLYDAQDKLLCAALELVADQYNNTGSEWHTETLREQFDYAVRQYAELLDQVKTNS